MATCFIQFSCLLDVGLRENIARAIAISREMADELDRDDGLSLGFEVQLDRYAGAADLWIFSEEDGEPEHVVRFVLRCAEEFELTGLWGFQWALSCSGPELDSYGGGAHLLDLGTRRRIAEVDCARWLATRLARRFKGDTMPASKTHRAGSEASR